MPDQGDNELENAEFVQLPIELIKPAVIPELEANRTESSNSHETLPAPPESSLPVEADFAASGINSGASNSMNADSTGSYSAAANLAGVAGTGFGANGSDANGSDANGSGANGSGANGSSANGSGVNGSGVNGFGANGGVNGSGNNGSSVNGAAADPALAGATPADPTVAQPAGKDKGPNYFSLLQEKDSGGIEILVQMANRGELDPKNIDIIDATDRFLKAIAAAPRENLRQSGKIIFHASVLLRMKAEALLITRIEDLDVGGGDDFVDFDVAGSPIIFDSNDEAVGRQITLADLQRALVRRSKQKQSRSRRVTLEQLIESLREAEKLEKKRIEKKEREPKAVIQMDGYHAMEDMDDILDLAHDEDIEDVIARIEQLLIKKMEDMLRLSLGQLIKMLDGGGDWVDAFLAVLFLSNAGKINLEQEVFYGPLYLVKNATAPVAEVLEATGTDGAGMPVGMAELKAISAEFMSTGIEYDGTASGQAERPSAIAETAAHDNAATGEVLNEVVAPLQLAAPLEYEKAIGIGEAKRKRKPVAAKRPGGTSKREKIGKNKKNENQLELEIVVPLESISDMEPRNSSSLEPDEPEEETTND